MRCRIYKRKVVVLALVVVACGLALWSSGKQKKDAVQDAELEKPHSRVHVSPGIRKMANESAAEKVQKPEVDNMTLVYRSVVFQLNFDQTVKNADTIKRPADDVVIVVQVHNRPEYLRYLLESLRRAKGIENVLLIFSHDYWSPEINQIVAGVDFCQVLQIFFPFSIQLYPNEFPGHDPKDCPRDIEKKDAIRLGCINAEYPDSFGHYREAKFSQTKHHWWWKLHFVWEKIKALKDHKGLVLLIEEDHYLAPDFYYVLKKMWNRKNEECPDCDVLTLGTYTRLQTFSEKADKVEVKTWKSTEHNMGMAMSRDTYQRLIQCTDAFCSYDDYNWDWTLQHLTVTCLPKFWKVLVPEVPRIYHTGSCGMHHKKSCKPTTESAKLEALFTGNQDYLFPENLVISKRYSMAALSPHVKNGGWGDIRDHELCKSYRRLQ
ncbi:alpha-1,6-mannosyl-glycoprotein 2-beta-N-acetylglucosaminyltransferase [Bufo gargarizans]|uniref:alpha-1,6-mannosyl-glycoprotein 2-beta-N-acetylglucosaminyltransferase n=1 Tax=Bufo gargarizans TaxID=30331 RepID=UPI001CF3CB8C|nr:alpha-1,6-mannosyl-glycoprotein 2-beta-N-acetylglucosaminyltransferase [Bufo gargarizans]